MFQFNPLFPDATDEQKIKQIRLWRNRELVETDWTMISDASTDKEAWAEYRQALRDLPSQNADPKQIVFPTRPS
jgi:hypothetical protein